MSDIIISTDGNISLAYIVTSLDIGEDPEIGVGDIQVTSKIQDVTNLSDILDVDTSNLNGSTNKYVMIFDATRNKYMFVNPDNVLDASVGITNDDPNPVGMSSATLDYLDQALDDRIDLDAGEW